jgi:AAA domain
VCVRARVCALRCLLSPPIHCTWQQSPPLLLLPLLSAVLHCSVTDIGDGWHAVRLAAAAPNASVALRAMQYDRDASIVVLSLLPGGHDQQHGSKRARGGSGGGGAPLARLTGLARRWELETTGEVHVHVRPWCGRHPATVNTANTMKITTDTSSSSSILAHSSSPCVALLALLESNRDGPWRLSPGGAVVTTMRELRTLARINSLPLCRYLLAPAPAAAAAGGGDKDGRRDKPQQQPPLALPQEVRSEGFSRYLHESFDGPQADAVKCAAAHLAAPLQCADEGVSLRPGAVSVASSELQAAAVAGVLVDSAAAATAAQPTHPFTLVQGPPGTGKTHTVLGVLNTWHLVLFQRFYASLDAAVRALADTHADGGRRVDAAAAASAAAALGAARGTGRSSGLERCFGPDIPDIPDVGACVMVWVHLP